MKIKLLAALALLSIVNCFSQCSITNTGFENWKTTNGNALLGGAPYSFEEPTQNWYSSDDHYNYFVYGSGLPVLNKVTDVNSGTYAVKMNTPGTSITTMYGIGKINYHATDVTGYYKFTGQTGDSVEIKVSVVKGNLTTKVANNDTANMVLYGRTVFKSTISSYTQFTIPLHKTTTVLPDSFHIGVYVYSHHTPNIFTYFDDICFETQTGIEDNGKNIDCNLINIGSNNFNLSLKSNEVIKNITAKIFDITGREVLSRTLIGDASTEIKDDFNLSGFRPGIYFLRLQGKDILLNKKFLAE